MRIRLIGVTEADAAALFAALDDAQVWTYISPPYADGPDGMARLIARWSQGPPPERADEAWLNFLVVMDDGSVVGHVQATIHATWAEVAWVIGRPWWGRGIATRAAEQLLARVATYPGVETVWATVHPDNDASLALLRRLGFVASDIGRAPELASYDAGDAVFSRPITR